MSVKLSQAVAGPCRLNLQVICENIAACLAATSQCGEFMPHEGHDHERCLRI